MTDVPFNKIRNHVWYVKWLSSLLVVTTVALTSFDITPLNKWLGLVATFGWLYVSLRWHDRSMIVMNSVLIAVYAAGLGN